MLGADEQDERDRRAEMKRALDKVRVYIDHADGAFTYEEAFVHIAEVIEPYLPNLPRRE